MKKQKNNSDDIIFIITVILFAVSLVFNFIQTKTNEKLAYINDVNDKQIIMHNTKPTSQEIYVDLFIKTYTSPTGSIIVKDNVYTITCYTPRAMRGLK